MATNVNDLEDAVEVIVNVLYLIEVDIASPENVLRYVKMTDRPITTLMRLVEEVRAAA